MPKLMILVTATRDGRKGAAVADWFHGLARDHGGFEVELVDLREVALPMFDEPNHPMRRTYLHDHTRAWSARVAAADAFVFVVPEYNHGMPPALLNAFEYLFHEWSYKAAAFVSYGGVSGGTRGVEHVKPVMTTLKMMPIPESVILPFFAKHLKDDESFDPGEALVGPAKAMLDELLKWERALATLRT